MINRKKDECILIVDDNVENVRVLGLILSGEGYKTSVAMDGYQALRIVEKISPDLILLDVMMPDMNGFETCERLKASPDTADIPVFFLTAKTDTEDIVRGFRLGAADYLTKPFQREELLVRVRNHLELKQHRDHLEGLAEHRARQLIHAERLATLGTLAAGIAHEIRNPLHYLMGFAELMELETDSFSDYLTHHFHDQEKAENEKVCLAFMENARKYLPEILKGAGRITSVTESMRIFSRKDGDDAERRCPVCIGKCIDDALKLCSHELRSHVAIQKNIDPNLPEIIGSSQQMEQVLINLFKNAADAIASVGKGKLRISAISEGAVIRISVEDTGTGISDDQLDEIWTPFFTSKDADKGTGLGLSISRGIVEDHKGSLWVERPEGGGARFVIEIPAEG